MGLGTCTLVSLAEVREAAHKQRKLIFSDVDPIDAKRSERAARARRVTFEEAAERYIAAKESGWRNDKHRAQWYSVLTLVRPS
jgi:hypothetical protein